MKLFRRNDRKISSALRLIGSAVALLGVCIAEALGASGTVRGRVLNETTGEYLEGAYIQIIGTGITSSTNNQGGFRINGVPEGTYDVRVSYLGLGTQTMSVDVAQGVSKDLEFKILEDVVELDGFSVQSTLTGRSAAINQQRVSSGLVTVISEEDFGQVNDGNIGLALEKMPGLSVDTDGFSEIPRYVNIRGVDTQYVNVQLDGNRMPSSGTGSPGSVGDGGAYGDTANGMALDDVPGDAVTNVEIWKNPLPEHDGDSLGGLVNLQTRSAFQRSGRHFAYKVGMNVSNLRDKWEPNFGLSFSDIVADGTVGVSGSLSYHNVNEGFDNIDYDWIPMFSEIDFGSDQARVNSHIKTQLQAGEQETGQEVIFFHEDTEYNNYNIERERIGLNLNFDFRVGENTELFLKTTYNEETRDSDDIRHHLIMDNDHENREDPYDQFVSLYQSTDSRYDAGNYFTFADTYTGDLNALINDPSSWGAAGFDPGSLVRLGSSPDRISTLVDIGNNFAVTSWNPDGTSRGRVGYEGEYQQIDIDFLNLNFGGKTELPWGTIDYSVFHAESSKTVLESDTEFRRNGFQFSYDRARDPFQPIFTTLSGVDRFSAPTQGDVDEFFLGFFELNDRTNKETYYGLESNLAIPFADGNGEWKMGLKFQFENRELDWDELQFSATSAFPFADFLRDNPYEPIEGDENYRIPFTPDVLAMRAAAANSNYFSLRSGGLEDSFEQDYEASRDTMAAYVQGKWKGDKWEFIAGVRAEEVEFESTQFIDPGFSYVSGQQTASSSAAFDNELGIRYTDGDGNIQTIQRDTRSKKTSELLPSAHLKYFFSENLTGRFSVGRTYGRPNFSDLLGITRINENDNPVSVNRGNADLPNLRSDNLDLSLEYYTENGGLISAGFFYKDMENFSYSAVRTGTAADFGLDPSLGDVEVTTAEAGPGAKNYGLELAWYQNLGAFGEAWKDFSLNANTTLTTSDAIYPGRTDHRLPTRGASNTLYFVGLNYEKGGFKGAINYRFRSQYIEGLAFVDEQESSSEGEFAFVGDDQFDDDGTWNIDTSYKFNDGFGMYLNVTNVLESARFSVQGYRQYGDDSYWNKRRINIGFTGDF